MQTFCHKRLVYSFGSCIMLKSLLFYYRQTMLSTRFRVKVLNQIGSLRRKMTNWRWACWDMSSTCRDGSSGIWAYDDILLPFVIIYWHDLRGFKEIVSGSTVTCRYRLRHGTRIRWVVKKLAQIILVVIKEQSWARGRYPQNPASLLLSKVP